MGARQRVIAAGSCLTLALTLLGGPLSGPGGADAGAGRLIPTGTATAAGVVLGYSDQDNFYQGSVFDPPYTYVAYATGAFDTAGLGAARAALGYNPYQEALAAINGVAPGGAPQLPAGEFREMNQASVQGQAPQSRDASLVPGNPGLAAGTMRAGLEENGPVAMAEALAAAGQLTPDVTVASAHSTMRISLEGGKPKTIATVVLKKVRVAEVLTFEAIELAADALADGAEGTSAATVRVVGAAVGGTPVELTDEGLVVAGDATPLEQQQLSDALSAAGLEVLASGGRTLTPGGNEAAAVGRGPTVRITSPQGHRLEFTLGVASAVARLFRP